ncbi:hypothetical protein GQ53DRAFT_251210 [Thozetella sp. PMI_491]|nr:hypothetical protein GQ53DRAFT_251210 [Thozetella sp. PMI_491]
MSFGYTKSLFSHTDAVAWSGSVNRLSRVSSSGSRVQRKLVASSPQWHGKVRGRLGGGFRNKAARGCATLSCAAPLPGGPRGRAAGRVVGGPGNDQALESISSAVHRTLWREQISLAGRRLGPVRQRRGGGLGQARCAAGLIWHPAASDRAWRGQLLDTKLAAWTAPSSELPPRRNANSLHARLHAAWHTAAIPTVPLAVWPWLHPSSSPPPFSSCWFRSSKLASSAERTVAGSRLARGPRSELASRRRKRSSVPR